MPGPRVEFGIQGSGQLTDGLPDPGHFRAVAELAESLGFDSIWAGEHLSFHNPILDLGVALTTFATCTRRIGLGAGVVLLPLRHPSLVAKQAASIDYLSGGRLVLGIGVGGEGEKDFEAAGVPLSERGSRADEGIQALRALFGPPPASFTGRHYRFEEIEIAPRAAQPDGPPIVVGGSSPAAQRRAGRLGDGWLPYMLSARRYRDGLAAVHEHAEGAERDPGALIAGAVLFALVGDDGDRAREAARAHLSERYGMRFEPHHVARLCVVGTPTECQERLGEYIDAGARHLCLNVCAGSEDVIEQCARLHAEVIEPLRGRVDTTPGTE
jgi:probable F420-dependent oxidoreductase